MGSDETTLCNADIREQQVKRHCNKDKSPLEQRRISTLVAGAGALPIKGSDAEAMADPLLPFLTLGEAHES